VKIIFVVRYELDCIWLIFFCRLVISFQLVFFHRPVFFHRLADSFYRLADSFFSHGCGNRLKQTHFDPVLSWDDCEHYLILIYSISTIDLNWFSSSFFSNYLFIFMPSLLKLQGCSLSNCYDFLELSWAFVYDVFQLKIYSKMTLPNSQFICLDLSYELCRYTPTVYF